MKNDSFIKFLRNSKEFDALIKIRPTAFALLALIARRARRTGDITFDGLEIGEALIGDYRTYGVTEQVYRTDKKYLKKFNFATFKATPKGTIARLINSSIFDINPEHSTDRTTDYQRTTNDQPTTNKNDKKPVDVIEKLSVLLGGSFKYENGKAYRLSKDGWNVINSPAAYLKPIESNNSAQNSALNPEPQRIDAATFKYPTAKDFAKRRKDNAKTI